MTPQLEDTKAFSSAFNKAKKRKRNDAVVREIEQTDATTQSNPKKKKQRPSEKKAGHNDNASSTATIKKKPLSREALDLSSKLKECSKNKNLEAALALFWDKRNDGIRDQFHASIAIDCCARCGALEEITRILKSLKEPARVETNTGAIKGYSHGGDIRSAFQLYESMLERKAKLRPNVRTLNTLLRGCLWTAAALDNKDQIFGGIVTAETAWDLYETKSLSNEDNTSPPSYEYIISLLCQALRTEEAETKIRHFRNLSGVEAIKHIQGGDQSSLETLAISYAGLARAKALLGDKKGALEACEQARRMVKASTENKSIEEASEKKGTRGRHSVGGTKQAWKDKDERRVASNATFRDHRMAELEINLEALEEVCQCGTFPLPKGSLANRIVNGLFYFSGGGTTQLDGAFHQSEVKESSESKTSNPRGLRRKVINSSWLSFGLKTAVTSLGSDVKVPNDFLRVKDSERIYREIGKNPKAIQDNGCIDFGTIFSDDAEKCIDVELGSGYGEWIVNQASSMPDRNHVAVELRADRVYQIFAKGMLQPGGPLKNLAVVGDDCSSFLLERVKPHSISTIFANHPEPPTQVQGKADRDLRTIMNGGPEPAHMLSSRALIAAGKVLLNNSSSQVGRIVIVTDNMNYARLLCATVVRINRQKSSRLQSCSQKAKALGLREVETFLINESNPSDGRVHLLEGQPSPKIGHASTGSGAAQGSSYFDRLWRTGTATHASKRERYVLVLVNREG